MTVLLLPSLYIVMICLSTNSLIPSHLCEVIVSNSCHISLLLVQNMIGNHFQIKIGDLAGDIAGDMAGDLARDLAGDMAGDMAGSKRLRVEWEIWQFDLKLSYLA